MVKVEKKLCVKITFNTIQLNLNCDSCSEQRKLKLMSQFVFGTADGFEAGDVFSDKSDSYSNLR